VSLQMLRPCSQREAAPDSLGTRSVAASSGEER
jgi:hypothetical protein